MGAPPWLDELTATPGPPWHVMGTRAVAGAWLVPEAPGEAQLVRKRAVFASHRAEAVAARAGSEAACAEAAATVLRAAGNAGGGTDLVGAALTVPEDLCVLVRRGGSWCLDAGVVCFPSMWSLRRKLGRPMAEVHGPVPGYADELAARVDRFLDRLERPAWRRNWLVHDDPELHLPAAAAPRAVPVPEGLWLRSERQTLVPLPETGAVLFTIRTQQVPFAVLDERPDVAGHLGAAIASWSPALVAYRGAGHWRDAALAWLDDVCRAGAR